MYLLKRVLNLSLIAFLLIGPASAQSPNNMCGVTAVITPGNDSVINSNTIVFFHSASINATSYKFIIDYSPFGLNTPVNYVFPVGLTEVKLVAYNGNCSDTAVCYYFYPGTFPPDTNNIKAYYGIASVNQYVKGFIPVSTGGYLMAGERNNNSFQNLPQRGYLIKIKESGCVDWAVMLNSSYLSNIDVIKEAADGGFFVSGMTEFNYPFFAKLDAAGNLSWSKKITDAGGANIYIYSIAPLSDGGLVMTGAAYGSAHLLIIRMDAAGNIIWQKEYDKNNQAITAMRNILIKGNHVFIGGNFAYIENATNYNRAVMLKLDLATGQTVWTKRYSSGTAEIATRDLHNEDTLLLVNASSAPAGGTSLLSSLIRLDTAGNVVNSAVITQTDEYYVGTSQVVQLPGKKYYILSAGTKPLQLQPLISYQTKLVKLDSNYQVLWAKHYAAVQLGQFFYATSGPAQELVIAGNETGNGASYWNQSGKIALKKIDSSGLDPSNCNFYDWPVVTQPVAINQQPFSWTMDAVPANSVANFPVNFYAFNPEMRYKCPDYIDSCSFLQVTGPGSICNINNTYTYTVHKRKSCGQPTQWSIPPGVTVTSQTDTSVTVRFPNFGGYAIGAGLPFGCFPLKDSVTILAASITPPVNLGNDISICPGNTTVLHAGPKYLLYQWKDGTTDSLLSVTAPGQYWVQVTDSCGNVSTDTVNINLGSPIPLSIGADRNKCNNDTLQLSATAGFMNYKWSPNYNISSTTAQNTVVNPAIDTSYTLIAEKKPGCFAYDTVRISVFHSPPVNLGPDKSFCKGDSAVLDAGAGFNQYSWSNSMTAQKITVFTAGTYSLIGTSAAGCRSYDTVRILNVFSLPVVNLDPDSTLCNGDTRILDAGPGLSLYSWNNGSAGRTISVSNTGVYAVLVTDNNGCKGTDTTWINKILALPAGFLPADTSICSYGTLVLKPSVTYNRYTWSNGAVTPGITIAQPGLYWLQVKDQFNCSGTDSVTVNPKECLKGFYIPSAFTPNNDGKNDIYRPLLFGNIIQYKFVVYNRWGEIIFQSTNPAQGWNGLYNGIQQDNNIFAWVCTYQLQGEEKKMEKGTVLLIK